VEEPLVAPFSDRSIIQLSLGWWRPKKRFLMTGVWFRPEALIIALQTTQGVFCSSLIRTKLQKLAAGTAQWICVIRAITFAKSSSNIRARKRDEMSGRILLVFRERDWAGCDFCPMRGWARMGSSFRMERNSSKTRAHRAARSRSQIQSSSFATGSREYAPDDRLRRVIKDAG
jgi:hypothetical protein